MKKLIITLFTISLFGCKTQTPPRPTNLSTFELQRANQIQQRFPVETTTTVQFEVDILNDDKNNHSSHDIVIEKIEETNHTIETWDFIKQNLTLTIPNNYRIDKERTLYLHNLMYLDRAFNNSEPYINYIVAELHHRNMPIDLVVLPLVESNYLIKSKSKSSAAGLWQIVPITAKWMNLEHSRGYDGRYDFMKSTSTALDLLEYLNRQFDGDWLLTIAAYNAGEGAVKRAMEKNRKLGLAENYWAISVSQETSEYVPKFLALIDIIKHNKEYGFDLPDVSIDKRLVKITIEKPVELKKLATQSSIEDNLFFEYNAAYTSKKMQQFNHIYVPKLYADEITNLLLKQGFMSVAHEYSNANLIQLLKSLGNGISNEIARTNAIYGSISNKNIQDYERINKQNQEIRYKVKSGDNLSSIAKKYRVSVAQIKKWNHISNPNSLKLGQTLLIYQK